jgi:hypothetical protein
MARFLPGMRNFAITPATKPMMMVKMKPISSSLWAIDSTKAAGMQHTSGLGFRLKTPNIHFGGLAANHIHVQLDY